MKGFMRKFLSCVLIGMIFISFIGTSQNALAASSEVNLTKESYNSTNYVQDTLNSLALNAEPFTLSNAVASNLRRPVSKDQPMWIVHIDSWNYADPKKIIDLIPKDILPYVVFNISLSINWDTNNKMWLMVQDGYETAKSWLRTCAENNVWAMIQPSSGGQSHFPDYDSTVDYENTIYGEFYRDYPNFIGFNYCEQFWGFESKDFKITPVQRYKHFAELLKLSHKYGGYLVVSWCGNQWSPNINPIAMLKRVPEFEEACRNYKENYILEEKYTQGSYISDMESLVLGTYLSGYCGNFGVRYDETGWTDYDNGPKATKKQYTLATGLPIHCERMALNGMTVIDGPELVWSDDFKELPASRGSDGYTKRQWAMHDQFQNDMIDLFRKVLDGTIRIPSRKEVIDRTKVVIVHDVNTGNNDDKYSTPATLFEGLYRMKGDGNLRDNTTLFKSTGRYPTIPTVYGLSDSLAKSFDIQIKKSQLSKRWPSINDKVNEMNKLFQSEYTGNCYAARNENTWVTYNPFKTGEKAGGSLSLKYNTCNKVDINYSQYTTGIINEFSDHLNIYLNNYDNKINKDLKTDVIKISGAKSRPTVTFKDRGINQKSSVVSEDWSNGIFTITIKHNGPIDLTVKCSGNNTNKLNSYKKATLKTVPSPAEYKGPRQYEAEFYDYKNIEGIVTNGCKSGIKGYQGQGFMKFGTRSDAAVRDIVNVTQSGNFKMKLRYAITSNNKVDLYVNGSKVNTLSLNNTNSLSNWAICEQKIVLNKGENTIELKGNSNLSSSLYLDNFVIESTSSGGSTQVEQPKVPGDTAILNDGWYYIKNVHAEKYLQVAGNEGKSGKNVELGTGTGVNGQKWYLKNVGNGYVTLKSALGNFMLDVEYGENKDGANIEIYNAHSGSPQQFMLKSSSNGSYVIATKSSNLTKVLDDYKYGKTDGTNVCQWTYGGGPNQRWIFEPVSNIEPTVPSTPSTSKLKLDYTINNWGSGYQVSFKITNSTNSDISNWTLKLKKSEINITSNWSTNLKEEGEYYVITPLEWNSKISKGSSIEFGVQGVGSIGNTLSYTLS